MYLYDEIFLYENFPVGTVYMMKHFKVVILRFKFLTETSKVLLLWWSSGLHCKVSAIILNTFLQMNFRLDFSACIFSLGSNAHKNGIYWSCVCLKLF